jgi:hypothetical protein
MDVVLSCKLIEEFVMWGGPPGCSEQCPRSTPPLVSVLNMLEEPDQGGRRGRGRPPHAENASVHASLIKLAA